MRPDPLSAPWRKAFRKGYTAGRQSLGAMAAIISVMALIVALYYFSPLATALLNRFARWQQGGGVIAAALASAFAGGFLSEASAVYFQDRGRWTRARLENVGFKMVLFFISGAAVFEFYRQQAVWFGNGVAWTIVLPKIIVDQLAYTPIWSVPFQTISTRWQTLHYSGADLRRELNLSFVTDRMLPVLVANWMFWIPGVTLIYALPQLLQMPLAILANAIWGLLLSATARQPDHYPTGTVQDLVARTSVLPIPE